MKDSSRYLKIVEWSEDDQTFVGRCPDIIGPCCHGPDEADVYRELCRIVDDWVEIMQSDGQSLPVPTKFESRIGAMVH